MEFIKHLKKNMYSKNTIKTYTSILNIYKKELQDIRLLKNKIASYFDSPNTAWTHYNVLCSYFKFSNDKRLSKFREIKMPRIPQVYRKVITKEKLMKKTSLVNDKRQVVIRFLFETGLRASELKEIISYNSKTLIVKGKGNKIREISHNIKTTSKLPEMNFTTKTLRLWVKQILGKEYSPHSIRRSMATHLLLKGANPKTVMIQLGHSKVETTYRYLQLSKEENIKIYNKYF